MNAKTKVESVLQCQTGEDTTVRNLNLFLIHSGPALSISAFFTCAAVPRTGMAELDLQQVLETTETIVQELLATGEFG